MTAGGSTALGERLAWYAARTRAMSPAELAWRAGNRLSGALGRRRSRPLLDPGLTWEQALADAEQTVPLRVGGAG